MSRRDPEKARTYKREWYQRNRELCLERCRTRKAGLSAEQSLYNSAKWRSLKHNLPFNIELSDITIPSHCPVLGFPLFRSRGRPGPNSPSLDRIVPALGYVKGNVIVVSHRANTLKGDATLAEMRRLCRFYEPLLST